MLLVGSFTTKPQARKFANFLLTQEITPHIRPYEGSFEIWIEQAEQLTQAKQHYLAFTQNPNQPEFQVTFKPKQDNTQQLQAHYRKTFKRAHGYQITLSLMTLSIISYLLMQTTYNHMILSYFLIGIPGLDTLTLWLHQPWRLITPILLHFSIWHILFNMYWLYQLGRLVETNQSRLYYLIFILVCAIFPNIVQLIMAGPYFGGASGLIYGLFGYVWICAKFNLKSGYYMGNDIVFWMIGWLILGFTGFLGPIANYAHLGGLIVGSLMAWIQKVSSTKNHLSR